MKSYFNTKQNMNWEFFLKLLNESTKHLNHRQIRIEYLHMNFPQEKLFNTCSKWIVLVYLLPVLLKSGVVTSKPSPSITHPLFHYKIK